MMNNKLTILIAVAISVGGCKSTPDPIDKFEVTPGSLRLQTQVFSAKYGVDVVAYHHSIKPSDDFIIDAPILLIDPNSDRQLALQEMFSGSPYIPLLEKNVISIYPLTTKYIPLAGTPKTEYKVSNIQPKKTSQTKLSQEKIAVKQTESFVDPALGDTDIWLGDPESESAVEETAKTASASVSKVVKSKSKNKTRPVKSNTSKATGTQQVAKATQDTKTELKPVPKINQMSLVKGQSYRDVLGEWVSEYDIDRVVYATSPVLRNRLITPSDSKLTISSSSINDLFTKLSTSLGVEDEQYKFKVRVVPHKGKKIAIVHQYPTKNVGLFEIKRGSLKQNAFRLAKRFDYKTVEDDDSGYTSWMLDEDPQISASALTAIPENVRHAYIVLLQNHKVKAQLLDGDKTVFFEPRNNFIYKGAK
ncbi:hypothetical protein AB6E94_19755 [Vibrio lentus]|uniref:hypothetical protein n=1 Tax=Vibrio splendidus TaxID=29497 RepID=UPI000C81B22E|nr:hypothetical protein [Vibrio splendidus]PMG17942.1 hypothetical protein BCU98_00990 [Vibrio splendidus]